MCERRGPEALRQPPSQAKVSLAEADKVGMAVENRDIANLDKAIKTATQSDIDRVYTNLLNGSRMHLQAYTNAANGVVTTHGPGMQQGMPTAGANGNAGVGTGNGYGPRTTDGTRMGNGAGGMGTGARDGSCLTS